MVIKPYTEFHEPGIEFGLTYFDDPGVNVPSAVTAWVALRGMFSLYNVHFIQFYGLESLTSVTFFQYIIIIIIFILGLPDFLTRMRQASKDYQKYKLMKQNAPASNSDRLSLSEEDVSKEQIEVDAEEDDKKSMRDYEDQQDDSANDTDNLDPLSNVQQENDIAENKDTTINSASAKEEQGLLHYFYITKLFASLDT